MAAKRCTIKEAITTPILIWDSAPGFVVACNESNQLAARLNQSLFTAWPKVYHTSFAFTIRLLHINNLYFLVLHLRLFFMIQFVKTTHLFAWISMEERLLCSSEKQNGVLCIRGPRKYLPSPHSLRLHVLPRCHQAAGELSAKVTAATKGIILHMQWRTFCKGLT